MDISERIELYFDKVLIKENDIPDQTKSGIYTGFKNRRHRRPSIGKIVAIGPDVKSVKIGDEVIISRYSGRFSNLDDIEYVLVVEDEILAIVDPDSTQEIWVGDTPGYMNDIIDPTGQVQAPSDYNPNESIDINAD